MDIIFYLIIFFCILGLFFAIKHALKEYKNGSNFTDILWGPKEYRKSKKYNLLTLPLYFLDLLYNKNGSKLDLNKLLDKYSHETNKYSNEARKIFPSAHLVNKEDEWWAVVEKQNEYSSSKSDELLNKFQNDYNLTDNELKELKGKIMSIRLEQFKKAQLK